MTKKQTIVFAIAVVAVVAIYYYLYRDSFAPRNIHISHTFRSLRQPTTADEDDNSVIFSLLGKYQLKSVKVLCISELETNKYAHPLWELISDSNSAPTMDVIYGHNIRGMHPAIKGAKAEPLTNDIGYRLIVETATISGTHDFKINEDNRIAQ